MKIILFLGKLADGGAERSILTLFNEFLKQQVETHLILIEKELSIPLPSSKNIHFLLNDDIIHFKPIRYLILSRRLKKLLKQIGTYDIFISNLWYADQIAKMAKVPNLFFCIRNTISKSLINPNKNFLLQFIKKNKIRKVYNNGRIITISNGLHNDLLNTLKIIPKSIQTIYNPIDIELIIKESLAYIPPINNYMIHIGRLHIKQKRQDLLIKSYALLKKENINLPKLILMGKGADENNIKKMIQKNDLCNDIILIGFYENPYPWIKNAKLLILSSDYEGFGRVIAESLALQTRVVSTNCPYGPNEILINYETKFLAQPNNEKDLALKIKNALGDSKPLDISLTKKFYPSSIAKQFLSLNKS